MTRLSLGVHHRILSPWFLYETSVWTCDKGCTCARDKVIQGKYYCIHVHLYNLTHEYHICLIHYDNVIISQCGQLTDGMFKEDAGAELCQAQLLAT